MRLKRANVLLFAVTNKLDRCGLGRVLFWQTALDAVAQKVEVLVVLSNESSASFWLRDEFELREAPTGLRLHSPWSKGITPRMRLLSDPQGRMEARLTSAIEVHSSKLMARG